MRGIITKDLYEFFFTKQAIVKIAFLIYALIFILLVSGKNLYTMLLIVSYLLPLTGPAIYFNVSYADEQNGFDHIQWTYPLSRKQIITAKYFLGCIMTGLHLLASLMMMMFYVYVLNVTNITIGFQIWLFGVVVALFSIAINYYLITAIGQRATVYIMVGLFLFSIFVFIRSLFYIPSIFEVNYIKIFVNSLDSWLSWGLLIAFISLFISYKQSVKVYSKKFL